MSSKSCAPRLSASGVTALTGDAGAGATTVGGCSLPSCRASTSAEAARVGSSARCGSTSCCTASSRCASSASSACLGRGCVFGEEVSQRGRGRGSDRRGDGSVWGTRSREGRRAHHEVVVFCKVLDAPQPLLLVVSVGRLHQEAESDADAEVADAHTRRLQPAQRSARDAVEARVLVRPRQILGINVLAHEHHPAVVAAALLHLGARGAKGEEGLHAAALLGVGGGGAVRLIRHGTRVWGGVVALGGASRKRGRVVGDAF